MIPSVPTPALAIAWQDALLFVLILWALTGLTIIHLGVLGWRYARLGLRRLREGGRPEEPSIREPPPPLSVGFIVPVYNDAMTVGPCIESILRQSVPPKSVVVVNDGSTDGTSAAIEEFRDRGVTIVHLEANGGKTRAIEEGLKHLDTDLVAITDADSLLDGNYVREILESFRDEEVVAAGGAVESIPHTWITAARQIEYMMTVNVDRNAENDMDAIVVLPGVSSTYRRSVLLEFGFEYDTIAEDFDLTFRMQKAGRKIVMNLRAKVYTSDPPTIAAYYRQLTRWYTDFWIAVTKHRQVFFRRVFGTVELPMMLLNTIVASVLYLTLPIYLLIADPPKILHFIVIGTVIDGTLIVIAHIAYKRTDVYWALLARYPTRVAARIAFLVSMVRVLVGKPGMAWTKLERRRTDAALKALVVADESRALTASTQFATTPVRRPPR